MSLPPTFPTRAPPLVVLHDCKDCVEFLKIKPQDLFEDYIKSAELRGIPRPPPESDITHNVIASIIEETLRQEIYPFFPPPTSEAIKAKVPMLVDRAVVCIDPEDEHYVAVPVYRCRTCT